MAPAQFEHVLAVSGPPGEAGRADGRAADQPSLGQRDRMLRHRAGNFRENMIIEPNLS